MLKAREELERRFGPFIRPQPEPVHSSDEFGITDADVEMLLKAQESGAAQQPQQV